MANALTRSGRREVNTARKAIGNTMPISFDRISHCPETGIDLDSVDIAKHVLTLWPALDDRDNRYVEACHRRAHLLHEHAARTTEHGMSHSSAPGT